MPSPAVDIRAVCVLFTSARLHRDNRLVLVPSGPVDPKFFNLSLFFPLFLFAPLLSLNYLASVRQPDLSRPLCSGEITVSTKPNSFELLKQCLWNT